MFRVRVRAVWGVVLRWTIIDRDVNAECLHVVMHGAFRPCAVVDIPKERIDVIFAYGNTYPDSFGWRIVADCAKAINCLWELRGGHYGSIKFRNQTVHSKLSEVLSVDELDVVATLTKTVEKFSRRIEQLSIIKEVGILVALAGTSVVRNRGY